MLLGKVVLAYFCRDMTGIWPSRETGRVGFVMIGRKGRVVRTFSRGHASGTVPGEAPFDKPGHLPDFEMRLLGVGFFESAVLALPLRYLW